MGDVLTVSLNTTELGPGALQGAHNPLSETEKTRIRGEERVKNVSLRMVQCMCLRASVCHCRTKIGLNARLHGWAAP